ncbi:MAG: hypothetical protein WA872_19040, partial [Candidatus Sulfotelmatobacter sp.]
ANIERVGKNFSPLLLSNLLCCGLQGLGIAGAHGDATALGGEGLRCGAANPLTGSRNQSDSILQAKIHRT